MNQPLIITAQLAAGIAHTSPWGISLDGILAAHLWSHAKQAAIDAGTYTTRALHHPNPPDLDLPLAKCHTSNTWHWAATCSQPVDPQPHSSVHLWTGRIDHRHLETTTSALPKNVSQRQGRYRNRHMPLVVTVTTAVRWHAVGDKAQLQEILSDIASIGKKRSTGEGHVLRWSVEESPHPPVAAAHLHPDLTLGRPIPAECFDQLDLPPAPVGVVGIRPPSMHPSRRYELCLPEPIHG